jgi:ABC-type multidrug transport system ATPase subunit
MLEIKDASLESGKRLLLTNVSARYPLQHFGAIIGPSGCGKTTLLKFIAGIAPGKERGEVHWNGVSLNAQDFDPSEIAYVPQFAIGQEELTVRETVRFSLRLRVRGSRAADSLGRVEQLLEEVGLGEIANQRVRTLSGGQRRRLALAVELTSRPEILLCDEVTSGLDPQAESEIVHLLSNQAQTYGRLVLTVTHSLAQLEHYDSVLVLVRGRSAYHGHPSLLCHYFGVEKPEDLYGRLASRPAEEWATIWENHREEYAPATSSPGSLEGRPNTKRARLPGAASQFSTLLARRSLVFARSLPQIFLQAGLILGFPLVVTLFALDGLPAVENLSMGLEQDVLKRLDETKEFLTHSSKVGSIVSGIAMFQVILLTLMGANNSGREIAAERPIFEKEKLSGLRPSAYIASKAVFLSLFVIVQSVWMGIFVHYACRFPGDVQAQISFLLLVNTAITSICLGISSWMNSAEQASLVSIYLVGFQLPLSGAVLALPDALGPLIRPLISAYWSWSGILETLRHEQYYDIVQSVAQSPLSAAPMCVLVLVIHGVLGLTAAWAGCERRVAL